MWKFRCDTLTEFKTWVDIFSTALRSQIGKDDDGQKERISSPGLIALTNAVHNVLYQQSDSTSPEQGQRDGEDFSLRVEMGDAIRDSEAAPSGTAGLRTTEDGDLVIMDVKRRR